MKTDYTAGVGPTADKTIGSSPVTNSTSAQNKSHQLGMFSGTKFKFRFITQLRSLMHELYIFSSKIKVNIGKNVVAWLASVCQGWPILPSWGLGKWLLRNLSYSNRMNHYQYPLNCDGNFLTKKILHSHCRKINTSQWFWQIATNKQYYHFFKLQRLFSLLKHTWTTGFVKALDS